MKSECRCRPALAPWSKTQQEPGPAEPRSVAIDARSNSPSDPLRIMRIPSKLFGSSPLGRRTENQLVGRYMPYLTIGQQRALVGLHPKNCGPTAISCRPSKASSSIRRAASCLCKRLTNQAVTARKSYLSGTANGHESTSRRSAGSTANRIVRMETTHQPTVQLKNWGKWDKWAK